MPHLVDGYTWHFYSDASGASWLGLKLDGVDTEFCSPLPLPATVDEAEQCRIVMRAASSVKFALATAILDTMSPESFKVVEVNTTENIIDASARFTCK